jgi:hypothetical protein
MKTSCDTLPDLPIKENTVQIDGCACAIIGVSDDGALQYDYDLLVAHFSEHEGMGDEGGADWVSYNVIGGLPNTATMGIPPCII